jgi:cobalamin biosynthesis protein CbiG
LTATRRVLVLADDLIWADRLARLLADAGARPARAKTSSELDRELACADAVVVDLTARNYDPIAAVERSAKAGRRVLAVGQHDDLAVRRRALAAGAERVFAYRKIHQDGASVLRAWLELRGRAEAGR